MTVAADVIPRWKTPKDFELWLARRVERWVSVELRTPGAVPETFTISTPGLTAALVSEHFPVIRAWCISWQEAAARSADVEIEYEDWNTRNFGRVRIPCSARVTSVDGVARLLKRSADLSKARRRCQALATHDARLSLLADHWPAIVAMPEGDFDIVCRFVAHILQSSVSLIRLREVACAGMHTKFLEQNRGLVGPIMLALGIPGNASAKSWAGKLGFIDDETALFEIRDLDGHLLPYVHFALPASSLVSSPLSPQSNAGLHGAIVVENLATFRALPSVPGVIAIFGRGDAVRVLAAASWLAACPLLYAGDLDHAGFQMVAALRRGGLFHLETAFMDAATAYRLRPYWVADTSRPGSEGAYVGLREEESDAQRMMAEGPWRLEQERIAFDIWVDRLRIWRAQTDKAPAVTSDGTQS
ncbi:Wadjet anti-phage system protein JetD domain-containing protein [Bradyrhizobium uaiense]|uniref:DUF2399 domain-containing protein n=1 Tax=Bradyrhizobium uaiense TaxID=2594946 RepID=A0A6P1BK06_9BRAD|nr:Wadjet anti-phage system protein JetD domain-containing protein [Bradyrhizobium uaiense]NEU97911.1 hypothetical protein [Bradyrhizobium uaiense]